MSSDLIAIPCYNCEAQIIRVLNDLINLNLHFDCILIDNVSSDNTTGSIESFFSGIESNNNYKLIKNSKNYGLGGTHKIAFSYARENGYERVIILHGDDQASVSDIPRLLNKSIFSKKSVLGARFLKDSKLDGYQKSRIAGNKALNFIFSFVLKRKIVDLGSGLNIFHVRDLNQINFENLSSQFNFNVELLLEMINKDISFEFEWIHWKETDQLSNARNVSVALSMLKSLFVHVRGIEKIESEYILKPDYEVVSLC